MSTPGGRERRRTATYRKGQKDLASELLPFFIEIENERRLPANFWQRVMAIRSKLQDIFNE